jgi:DNA-binding MarR family transcriptional regulator
VSKATLSGVLTTLEKRGLVQRTKSEDDGRLVLVELTPRGRRLITKLFPKINGEETLATRLLPEGSKEDTAELLRLVILAVSDADA